MAVGRVARSSEPAPRERLVRRVARSASHSPYAAVAPIRGAPRTSIARMAWAASPTVRSFATANSCGRRVWSMISTEAPSAPGQIVR